MITLQMPPPPPPLGEEGAGGCEEGPGPPFRMPGIVDSFQVLPGDAQSRAASLVLPTSALHAHVSERMRDRIWSGDFVDMYLCCLRVPLTSQTTISPSDHGVTVVTQPCVVPKTKTSIRSISQWSRAFQIYTSVFLVKPGNALMAPKKSTNSQHALPQLYSCHAYTSVTNSSQRCIIYTVRLTKSTLTMLCR